MPGIQTHEPTELELQVFKLLLGNGPPFQKVALQDQAELESRKALERRGWIMLDPDGTAMVSPAGFVHAMYRAWLP